MHCQSEKKNKLLKLKLKSNQDPKIAQPQSVQNRIGPTSFEVNLNLADTVCHCFWQSQWRNRRKSQVVMQNPKMDRATTNTNTKRLPMQILVCVCKYTPHTHSHSSTITYIHLLWGSQSGVTYDYGKRVYSAVAGGRTQPVCRKTKWYLASVVKCLPEAWLIIKK